MGGAEEMGAPDMDSGIVALSKAPWLQRVGPRTARLRFETRSMQPLQVRLERAGAAASSFWPPPSPVQLTYEWPGGVFARRIESPDEPGLHNVQQVVFEGLVPGEGYEWVVHQGRGEEVRGSFVADAPRERGVRIGWIADTMAPQSMECVNVLARQSPDLVIHGGDLQYMSNPLDTWNGLFEALRPLTAIAPFHTCIGNHEYEAQDEFTAQYKRLFEGHGDARSTLDYAGLTYGSTRVLLLNSEIEMATPGSAQRRWLEFELRAARAARSIRHTIVAFHRPYFTFSRSKPNFEVRDQLHPLLVEFGVPLVLTGHNHCYERFEVDGVTYVMDGGGGALSYNPDHHRQDVLDERPSDEGLRRFSDRSYGVTTAHIQPDGAIAMERVGASGQIVESYTIG